jgi:hypothetical protein
MPTKFVCLANSFKEGGRCLAGIELDANNNPVIVNGRPKWIRPVCNTPHGEVPNHIAHTFNVFDMIEIDITGTPPLNYQSENVFFQESTIKAHGVFDKARLPFLYDGWSLVFGNRGKAVSRDRIASLDHSLMLIKTLDFEITNKLYSDRQANKQQTRLVFKYNNVLYDFPVTDPVFLYQYKCDSNLLDNINELSLCLSLGIEWENWYYKLVATIIF